MKALESGILGKLFIGLLFAGLYIICGSCQVSNDTSNTEAINTDQQKSISELVAKAIDSDWAAKEADDVINGNYWQGGRDQILLDINNSQIYKEFKSGLETAGMTELTGVVLTGFAAYVEYCRAKDVFMGDSVYCDRDMQEYMSILVTVNPTGEGPTDNLDEQLTNADKYLARTTHTFIGVNDITSKNAYKIFRSGGLVGLSFDLHNEQLEISFDNSYSNPAFKLFTECEPYVYCEMRITLSYSRGYRRWVPTSIGTKIIRYNLDN